MLAPALYTGNTLTCGPAVELNLVSDCAIELSLAHILLIKYMQAEFVAAMTRERYDKRPKLALIKVSDFSIDALPECGDS